VFGKIQTLPNSYLLHNSQMITKKHKKNKKIKFDEENLDYSWEITLGNSVKTVDHDYGNLLRNTFDYDPTLHEFDTNRFKISDE